MTDSKQIDDLKTPFYAALGAGDLALASVADVITRLRGLSDDGIDGVKALVTETVESAKSSVSELGAPLPKDLPKDIDDLRELFSPEELRKVASAYIQVATDIYESLTERGETAAGKLRGQKIVGENVDRVSKAYDAASARVDEAVELTEDALGAVATRTRAVGEKAAALTKRSKASAAEAADDIAEKAADLADKVADKVEDLGDAVGDAAATAKAKVETAADSVVEAAAKPAPKPAAKAAPAKAAPAKKAPAKKAPAKKAPAKKAPAKKAPGGSV